MTSNIKQFSDNIDTNFPVQGRDNPSQGFRDNFAQIKLALITAADEISSVQTSSSTPNFTLTTATATVLGGVKIGTGFRVDGDGKLFIDDIYTLPVATPLSLGGVKQGDNVTISGDGTLSVAAPFVLSTATASTLGGVRIGFGLRASGTGVVSLDTTLQNPFPIPPASQFEYGLVKIGDNVTIADGFISVAAPYILPDATPSTLGGVKIGSNVSIDLDGKISVAAPYVLPVATTSTLGGVRAGSGISINGSGVISAPYTYTLPPATTSSIGGVQIGDNIFVTDGVISVSNPYELPTASTNVKGGVKIGNGLVMDGSGFLGVQVTPPNLSTVTQSILPGTDIAYDLGSTTHRWKDLYLSSSTIYLGATSISAVNGVISIPSLNPSKLGVLAVGVVTNSQIVDDDNRYIVDRNWWRDNQNTYGPYTYPPVVRLANQSFYDDSPQNKQPTIRVDLDVNGFISDVVVVDPGFYATGETFGFVQDGISIEPADEEPITLTLKALSGNPPGGGTYTGDFFNQSFTYTWDGNEPAGGEPAVGVTTTYGLLKLWRQTYLHYAVVGSGLVESDNPADSLTLTVVGSVDDSAYWTVGDKPYSLPFSACEVGNVTFTPGVLATSNDLNVAGDATVSGTVTVNGSLTVNTDITFADGSILVSAIPTLPLYTTSTLNTIGSTATGAMILVTDLVGGSLPCFYDGTDWKTFAGTII
jgi:hypothetical protein